MASLKGVVTENLERLLERDAQMDLMLRKTEDMSSISYSISKKSRKVKNKIFWRGVMVKIAVGMIILVRRYFFIYLDFVIFDFFFYVWI